MKTLSSNQAESFEHDDMMVRSVTPVHRDEILRRATNLGWKD